MSEIPQSPYTPDIAPYDLYLFPSLKLGPKGKHFATIEDIKANEIANLKATPIERYKICFQ